MARKPQTQETQVQDSSDTPEVTPQVPPMVTDPEPVVQPKASRKQVATEELPHGATIETY
ncbi:hypothetical protein HJJEPNFP_00027 [Ralstonia phage BOESR1]|nr:hypothetical protein HJJEPNFP_00027 [Ralstonia phage BOESR1]